jgi:site-specific DNA-methyltransferase (adenine-specific)
MDRCKLDLRNCDCMDLMAEYPDKYFELAIVDPPYGIADNPSRHGGSGAGKLKNRVLNQNALKFKKWDIKPTENYFNELFRISKNQIIWGGNYFQLPPSRGFIVWDKKQPFPNFSRCEYAWISFQVPSKIFEFDNRTGEKIHPTQKPVALYKWILKNYVKQGDKILDTHLGSMSSAIACWDMGFDLTGAELDTDYYEQGIKRVEQHKKQLQLF